MLFYIVLSAIDINFESDILKLMVGITQTKTKSGVVTVPSEMMRAILEELRLLRQEIMLLFPQEDLEDYAHPDRVRNSYQKAIKEYPPVSAWK